VRWVFGKPRVSPPPDETAGPLGHSNSIKSRISGRDTHCPQRRDVFLGTVYAVRDTREVFRAADEAMCCANYKFGNRCSQGTSAPKFA